MSNITDVMIDDTLRDNYMPYAMYVIKHRALPNAFDGLKPVHRKSLYTAFQMKLSETKKTKSANLVGQIMKIHPHGDTAIYDALVRLTDCNLSLLSPYLAGKGNFSKSYFRDTSYAAARYTEIGLSDYGKEFFYAIDKNTVPFINTYDSKGTEPTLLPVRFPNVLINTNLGIAVGMASNICSFNLEEIANATIALMEDGNTPLDTIIKGPDFPTGANYQYDINKLNEVLDTGRGSFTLRSNYKYDKKSNCIEITEIPYNTTIEAVIDKIVDLVKTNKIREINDIRDETDKDGLKLTIDIKKNTDIDVFMEKMYQLTGLQSDFSCNFNMLIDDVPQVLGVKSILTKWIDWRMGCIKREIKFDIDKLENSIHVLESFNKILLKIDEVIDTIKKAKTDKQVVTDLMKNFDLSEIQAEHIANMKLRMINEKNFALKIKDLNKLIRKRNKLIKLLKNEKQLKNIIKEQIIEIRDKYKKPRQTKICTTEKIELTQEDFVEDFNCTMVLTKEGYLKKNLRYTENQALKDTDKIINVSPSTNKDSYLIFTSKGEMYNLKTFDFKECPPSSLGEYLPSVLNLDKDEEIIASLSTNDFKGFFVLVFDNNKVVRIQLSSYKATTKKLKNAINIKDKLVNFFTIGEDDDCEIKTVSSTGKEYLVNTSMLAKTRSKNGRGVYIKKPKKDEIILTAEKIKMEE